jgi:hypothetical protein
VPQHEHPVGDPADHGQVVGDEQQAGLRRGPDLPDQLQHLGLHGHVQRRRRLVGDQQLGLADQGHRDHDPLPHSARELVRIAVVRPRRITQVDLFHGGDRGLPRRLTRTAAVGPVGLGDLITDRVVRVQRRQRVLEDHRDPVTADPAQLTITAADQLGLPSRSEQPDRSADLRGRRQQAHDRQRRHRLAGAGLADQAERLAARHREGQSVYHRGYAAVGGREPYGQVRHLDQVRLLLRNDHRDLTRIRGSSTE